MTGNPRPATDHEAEDIAVVVAVVAAVRAA